MATIDIASERSGVDINVCNEDWAIAAIMRRMLGALKDAVNAMKDNYLALAQVPCIITVLGAHIEVESAEFGEGPSAAVGDEMFLDHADR